MDTAKFLRDFSKATSQKKVAQAAAVPYTDLKKVYPQIKDTLEKIRKSAYRSSSPSNKELRFLFDKMDADEELHNKNYEKATLILENALQAHTSGINDTLKCLALLKNAFIKMRNFNRAFEIQFLMESRWKRKSDTVTIDFGTKKSSLYAMMGLKTEALKERRKEFNARINKTDTDAIVSFYNDMGIFFNNKKNSDSAEGYFVKANNLLSAKKIPAGKESYYDFFKGLIDGNLAMSYFNRGNLEKTVPLLKRDIYYSIKAGFYESAFNSYNLMAQCQIQLKNKLLSRLYLDSAETLLDEKLKGANFKLKLLPTQATYFNLINDHKQTAKIYKDYFALNDSFLSLEKEKEMINQEITFNIEQRELAHLEKDKLLKQIQLDEAKQKSYKVFLFAAFLILVIIILFLIMNNRGFKKREYQLAFKNKQIRQQNSQIEQSLKEKEALIKEIHHRVKNNLQIITSMLNLQMGKVDDEKTELILFEAKQRISAIALTHQMLYQKVTISNIHIGEYIESLVRQVEATMATPLIELVTHIAPIESRLTIDGAVPLGLIINELLTNAYKHAFPKGRQGKITVSLIDNDKTITVKVSDNGVGLDENFEASENKTLGMELVYILAEQLDSELVIGRGPETVFKFDIKKTQLK